MGSAKCRFHQDEGCNETGGREWYVVLPDLNMSINVPEMWKHYMLDHLVQPTAEERKVIMAADPAKATGKLITTRGAARPAELMVLYVERTGPNQYTHEIGTEPDTEVISKLEAILEGIQPTQTKGFHTRPGYR